MQHRARGNQRNGQRRHNNHRQRKENHSAQNSHGGSANSHSDNNVGGRPVTQSILPSPEILLEYEYACEGTVARLMEMAETEQDRRNEWEKEYLRFHKKSLRLGEIFGFILLVSVIWGTVYLGSIGQDEVAKVLAVSGFFAVAAAGLFSEISKRLSRRPKGEDRM